MLTLTVGPLAFPAAPLVLLGALLLAVMLARRLARPGHEQRTAGLPGSGLVVSSAAQESAESTIWWSAAVGLLAARVGHLLMHAEAYAGAPATWLDVRDGGMHALSGWLAAALVLVWLLRRGRVHAALSNAAQSEADPAGSPAACDTAALAQARRAVVLAAAGGGLAWVAGQGLLVWWGARRLPQVLPPQALVRWAPSGEPAVSESALLTEIVAGRPAVVNLWASWCAPCRAEMPLLAAIQRQRPDVRVVFVNQGETAAAVQAYLARSGLRLEQVWLDPGSALGPAMGSRGLPTTLFVDAQGRIVDAHMGMLNASGLRVRLQRLQPAAPRPAGG